MLSKQERLLLARALMRRLWQRYDSGGHSMRSVRSRLLETVIINVWWVGPDEPDLPEINDSLDFFEKLTQQKLEPFDPLVPPPRTLQEVPKELFALLVLHVITTMYGNDEALGEVMILNHSVRLLNRPEVKRLLISGEVTADNLFKETSRRWKEKFDAETHS